MLLCTMQCYLLVSGQLSELHWFHLQCKGQGIVMRCHTRVQQFCARKWELYVFVCYSLQSRSCWFVGGHWVFSSCPLVVCTCVRSPSCIILSILIYSTDECPMQSLSMQELLTYLVILRPIDKQEQMVCNIAADPV